MNGSAREGGRYPGAAEQLELEKEGAIRDGIESKRLTSVSFWYSNKLLILRDLET